MSHSASDTVATPESEIKIDRIDLTPFLHPKPLVVVVSGTSGAGKDATIKALMRQGYPFRFVVTATTRAPRANEVHGEDYIFTSQAEFERMITEGELLEYARVYGDYKGIPKDQVLGALESGQDVILRVDVQGAAKLRQLIPQAVTIFVTASSEEELISRLRGRKTETAEALRRRLATAKEEMREICHFDYVVVNRAGELDRTVDSILAIIKAEKCRSVPRADVEL